MLQRKAIYPTVHGHTRMGASGRGVDMNCMKFSKELIRNEKKL